MMSGTHSLAASSGLRIVDRPTQLICISDLYLLSWRWRPLWSGGTLYQWSLRLKKASWVRFFFKISVLYTNCLWKSKKQDKKRAKNLQKKVFLSAPLTSWTSQATKVGNFCGLARPAGQRGWWKHLFLEGFCPFFVLFLAFSWTICVWNAFFAKKIVPFDLL